MPGNNKDINTKEVLVHPHISEKSTMKEEDGKYTFVVANDATKIDIKNAVEQNYGVRPAKVNTMNFKGKKKRFRFQEGKQKDWKKAIVTLPEGETINVHEEV
ncbi:MAG: 50S ribosomal protein L23 [Candidatus Paceibacteria bacterium]